MTWNLAQNQEDIMKKLFVVVLVALVVASCWMTMEALPRMPLEL